MRSKAICSAACSCCRAYIAVRRRSCLRILARSVRINADTNSPCTFIVGSAFIACTVFPLFHSWRRRLQRQKQNCRYVLIFRIQKSAAKLAAAAGEKFERENCFTVPVISLRKNVCKKSDAAQQLLLASDKFSETYTLISDDKAVYNAKTKKEAEHVLEEYIKRLSLGGNAKLSSSVQIIKRIISAKDVMSKEDCAYLLDHSGLVTVVSIADSSYEKNIPFGTETEADSNMYLGETVTLSEGSEGRAEVLRRTVYKNGIAEDVSVISEDVSVQPVARIIKVGTKQKDVLKTGVFMPLSGRLSSPFGPRWGRIHEGIDIAVPEGTPVKAAECGKVSFVSENAGGYGKLVRIDHGYGVQTAYGHLSKITAAEGDTVAAGSEIALSGNTGNSTGPHLHFEIIKDGEQIDPAPYIKK